MQLIPKIIHQTWKTDPLPLPFSELAKTWKTFLPDWEYVLWTDEMNREFIATEFPDFLEIYDGYSRNIQRADAIRYFILQKYGGLYVDIDFECLENIEPLLENAEFIAGKEPAAHARRFGKEYIICNAFMASVPEGNFIQAVCRKVVETALLPINSQTDVLDSTGPFMLTEAYKVCEPKTSICILEPEDIYPLEMNEKNKILQKEVPEDVQKRINRAYAVHYFWGNW